MKILQILSRMNIGGPAVHVVLLTRELRKRGHEVTLVTGVEAPHEGNMLTWAKGEGVEPIVIPSLGREISPGHDIATYRELAALLRREKPDVVHTHTAKAGTLGRLAARRAGIKRIVHTFHGHVFQGYFSPAKARAFLAVERYLGKRTDAIVALSPRLKDELIELRVGSPDKIAVVPLGFDLEPFERADGAAIRREMGAGPDTVLVGIVGRLTAIKNHELFLRAAAMLTRAGAEHSPERKAGVAADFPSGNTGNGGRAARIQFVVVGDGERRAELETMAVELGFGVGSQPRLVFTGWRADMPAVYAGLDIVALSSLNEGTPMTLLEAMAAGKPVVATDVGGVRDIVEDGANGLLVAASDGRFEPEVFAAKLSTLIADRPRAAAMGEAGRRFVREHHSLAVMTAALESLYREGSGLAF